MQMMLIEKLMVRVVLVLNPSDKADVDAASTVLTTNGTYVTVIPGGLEIVE